MQCLLQATTTCYGNMGTEQVPNGELIQAGHIASTLRRSRQQVGIPLFGLPLSAASCLDPAQVPAYVPDQ